MRLWHIKSEHPLWEVAQQQLLVAAALAHPLQGRVDHGLELGVAAVDGDADTVAEELGLGERSTLELAAGLGGRAVEPERQAHAVVEQEVDLAYDQGVAGELRRLVGTDRAVTEERAQVGL